MERKTPRQILSANLKALMQQEGSELTTIKRVADASGSKLSNGKVGRIYAASHTTDIDTLQDLAAVFKLEPWQLLVESFNPKALPVLVDHKYLDELRQFARQITHESQKVVSNPETNKVKMRKGSAVVGESLKRAFDVDGITDARSKSGGVQKPARRRNA